MGVGKPTMYASEVKLFFNFGLENKEIAINVSSFIVKKNEVLKDPLNTTEQPMVACTYTPKFDLKTGKKIQ